MPTPAMTWKEKAVQRRTQLKHLHKRLQETKTSRNTWKRKYQALKMDIQEVRRAYEQLKKSLPASHAPAPCPPAAQPAITIRSRSSV